MLDALVLAFALAMDATAVAATRGLLRRRGEALVLPLLFGAFQAGMAALGWLGARWGGRFVEAWDHWIAFGLLAAIGGKMVWEALRRDDDDDSVTGRSGPLLYLGLAIATSIDAAAAGVTLPALGVGPTVALIAIGVVTVVASAIGYAIGRAMGAAFGKSLEVLGGVILIALGVRVLVQHLW